MLFKMHNSGQQKTIFIRKIKRQIFIKKYCIKYWCRRHRELDNQNDKK